jgi:Dolichyl-phosphate-mannose-protein mannosyltransferase
MSDRLRPADFLRGPGGLVLILLLALLIRLPGLTTFGYGVDEGNTAAEALRLVDDYGWRYWDIPSEKLTPLSSSMPLSYYLAACGLETVGRDLAGLRLPFLILGLLGVALTWIVARRLTGSAVVAGLAALYLALNPAHISYSQLARFYMPTLVVGLIWVLALDRLVRRPSLVASVALAVVVVLGYLTHHLFALTGLIAVIAMILALRRPPHDAPGNYRGRLVLFGILAYALSSPPLLINVVEVLTAGHVQAAAEGTRSTSGILRNVIRAGGGAILRIEIPVLILSILGSWIAVRRCGRGGLLLVLMAFVLGAEIFATGSLGQIRGRYILWCLPYFAILAAVATRWTFQAAPRGTSAAVIAALVVAALGARAIDYHTHGDGRVAAGQVRTEARRLAGDDTVVILGIGPPPEARALAGWDMDRFEMIHTGRLPNLAKELEPLMDRRLILVAHQQTESFLVDSGLTVDRRLRRVGTLIDRARRQSLYYAFYEWRPD